MGNSRHHSQAYSGAQEAKIQASLMLQLGSICRAQCVGAAAGVRPPLRLIHCVASDGNKTTMEAREDSLKQWLTWARIPNVDVKVVESAGMQGGIFDAESGTVSFASANEQMRAHSGDASLVLVTLPALPMPISHAYLEGLPVLSAGLPPTLVSVTGQGFPVITTVI